MNAYTQLIRHFDESGFLYRLPSDILQYSQIGFVYIDQETVLMARPVSDSWNHTDIITGQILDLTYNVNTWHIHLAIGDISNCIRMFPYTLDRICFQRNGGRLRFYNFNKLQQLLSHGRPSKSTKAADTRPSRAG